MSEFSESRWNTLFINADCIVRKGEQKVNINEKNLWSVLTLCHVHVFSIALERCVQISHQAQVISKKEQDRWRWWKSIWQQDSSCLLFPSFRTLPSASKETKKVSLLSDTWAGAAIQIKRKMIQNGPEFHLEFFQSSRISQRLPTGASLALEEEGQEEWGRGRRMRKKFQRQQQTGEGNAI